ncbi:MAG: exo-alpha-sialidase, partial [Bacteroidetes bacterium]|nr:exo-alpha-sialidase [Bacteroidota bacterium]
MRTILVLLLFILFESISVAQNIMISNQEDPNEPSIVIDPKNPNVLVAGSNLNLCYVSIDTGYTWTQHTINSTYGVWGDPVLAVDTASNFYYFHLSNPMTGNWIDRIVCQKSNSNGTTWSNGSYAGLNGAKAQDKQWCAVDRTNNNIYLTWTQFDNYGSANPNDSSIILFSKSVDAGNTWSIPLRINKVAGDCMDSSNTVEGAVPAVGPNGEIYVAWAGPEGLVFNKSYDQGSTWLNNEIIVDPMPGGWDFSVSGIYRANGLPVITCDISNSPDRGTIYINWSDQRNGEGNTDIWLVKSTDGGQTWSSPKKVNDDNSNRQQFFTWMTIDQTNGYLYFVFYDRRNYTNDSTDVFVAVSTDGGNTFINRKISQSPFLPDKDIFFG